ncbi:MAG TPA: site-specific DNA-methyltransferase [Sphingomicrobium sp.]|nr:site-specific DNA-methyltransferase [Sphingomicrobium sp.]
MTVRILTGDCRDLLRSMPDESVHCCVTSPPYFGLRDYGVAGQIGLEPTPAEFVAELVEVFREVRRVLRADGTLWLNLGDSYQNAKGQSGGVDPNQPARRHLRSALPQDRTIPGLKPKDLIGVPWLAAFGLRDDGWYLRQDIIWSKPNPMPESVQDRCTKAHEYIFMFSKSRVYHYDAAAIAEPASETSHGGTKPNPGDKAKRTGMSAGRLGLTPSQRRSDKQRGHTRRHAGFNDRWDAMERAEQYSGTRNKRSVWSVGTQPFPEAHFATFPPGLIEPCILAGCPEGGTVLDPFGGAGTTGLVADRLKRDAILIELNPGYSAMAERRIRGDAGMFANIQPDKFVEAAE